MKFASLILVLLLTGCSSLIPKRVELGQEKVQRVPEAKPKEREIQRQTAQRAEIKAKETLEAALVNYCPVDVTSPAKETAVLTESVSRSLGPPLIPASPEITSDKLSQKLDTAMAKLNGRLDEFKEDNDKNAGKKIEDTGFLKIPYFVYLFGVSILVTIGFIVLRIVSGILKAYSLTNPPVALGLKAVQLGGKAATNLASEIIKGGEAFKQRVEAEINDSALKDKILGWFRVEHEKKQSPDTQAVVKELTN